MGETKLEIVPFRGIRYRVPDSELGRVLAPPYDVIGPAGQAALYERDPRNVVRLVLNRTPGAEGYAEAGRTLRAWLEQGVLAADPEPALYLLEQTFTIDGTRQRRLGLLARFRAVDASARVILPHEHTRAAAREDRYQLLKQTRANFSPIFLMFSDPRGGLERTATADAPPAAQVTDEDGVEHRLWRITAEPELARLAALLAATRAYIADGHHRYATALRWRDETGPDGAWTLGYFTPLEAPGLVVLPYHRLLESAPSLEACRARLAGRFRVRPAAGAREAAALAGRSDAAYAFALAAPGGEALVAEAGPEVADLPGGEAPPSVRVLDAHVLHGVVLEPLLGIPPAAVRYAHSLGEAEAALADGKAALACLMRATPVRHIVDVAEAGESMPAKSTFFFPKLLSGLVIHALPSPERKD